MNNPVVKTLLSLASELHQYNVRWAVGGSLLLYLKGISVTPNDIDLLVDDSTHDSLLMFLQRYNYQNNDTPSIYKTEYFYEINILGTDIDIMINFAVCVGDEIMKVPFHISEVQTIDNTLIPLGSLEQWRQIYSWMNRSKSVEMIDNYFTKKIAQSID